MKRRRTKKAYTDLYDDPTSLFKGCEVLLFPNGENEIWIRSQDRRRSFKITAGDGPAGLMIQVDRHALAGGSLSVSGNLDDGKWTPSGLTDYASVAICQYRPDDWSQQFKAWIADHENPHPGEAPDRSLLPLPVIAKGLEKE